MKNLIMVLLFVCATATACVAQQAPNSWQIGLTGGPTRTFFTRQNNSFPHLKINKDYRVAAGLSSRYQFQHLFLKLDLTYENKGFKTDYRTTDSNGDLKNTGNLYFNYYFAALPILVGVQVPNSGLFFNAGPYAAYLLQQTTTNDGPGLSASEKKADGTKDWERLDYGLSAGVGYSLSMNDAFNFSVEARHNVGLRNLSTGPIGYKSRSTNLFFGLHYNLTR